MIKDAIVSPCRKYRYALWRIWDTSKPLVLFICLNPSTADETNDDPTLRRCITFAKSWGYGGVCIANLFAIRATQPAEIKKCEDPIGIENDRWLVKLADEADLIIGAWGNDGTFQNRSQDVKRLLPTLHYLKMNASGEPAHPLYLPKSLKPFPIGS